jgi:hypothetical protein
MKRILLFWLAALPICISPFKADAQSALLINEIMYNTDKKSQEWIELYNPHDEVVNLAHWSIRDSRKTTVISVPALLIPGQSFIIISNAFLHDSLKSRTIVNSGLPEWNNSGDEMVLYNAEGQVSDSLVYSDEWGGKRFRSLERVQWDAPSTDPANWATCIDPAGHTAGRCNSMHAPQPETTARLAISPSPFSPDQDGIDDITAISYELSMTHATVHIKIYDPAGRQVRYLANSLSSGPQHTVYWDGQDDFGRGCRIGVYIVYLQAIDEAVGKVEQAKEVCVLARR